MKPAAYVTPAASLGGFGCCLLSLCLLWLVVRRVVLGSGCFGFVFGSCGGRRVEWLLSLSCLAFRCLFGLVVVGFGVVVGVLLWWV